MKKARSASIMIMTLVLVLNFSGTAAGASKDLDKGLIEQLRKSFPDDPVSRAMINAVTNNDLKELALNQEMINSHDDIFTFKVDAKGITNQKSSGRCWLFAGLNMMRPAVMEKYNLTDFEFSENHLFFWDKLEKANMFLEMIIETSGRDIDDRELQAILDKPVPDGGWWNYVVALIEKYGVVPGEVSLETKHSSATRRMNGILSGMMRYNAARLREMASAGEEQEALREKKAGMLEDVYRVLALHLGVPPEEFTWRVKNKDEEIIEKKFTPRSFYKEAVGVDLGDYVTIMDHAAYDYNKHYSINYCRNLYGEPDLNFVNLPARQFGEYAARALLENEPVWFAADIGKENNTDKGILRVGLYDYDALFGINHKLTKKEMVWYRHASANHAMVFVGVDRKDDKPVKWLVENSWGTDTGNKGYWTMYNDWFERYVFTVIINKKVLDIFDIEPERIHAWDPMRTAFDN